MLIQAENITIKYGTQIILKDITFHVHKGEYLNIIGPNGSGKSTLVKLLAGLIKPQSGILIHDKASYGYLPQHLRSSSLMPATVYEILSLSNPIKPKEDEIDDLLKLMNISDYKYQMINRLSGGEQQRVFIVRALLKKPEVLLLDEPTSALDPQFRKTFYDYIEKLNHEGMTIIHITHDLSDGLRHGSMILDLDQSVRFFGSFEKYQLEAHPEGGHHHHV